MRLNGSQFVFEPVLITSNLTLGKRHILALGIPFRKMRLVVFRVQYKTS